MSIDVKNLAEAAAAAMDRVVSVEAQEKFAIIHYGAGEVDPRQMAFWICIQTDAERDRLSADGELMQRLRKTLADIKYPAGGKDVKILFESDETVQRESSGDWYAHLS